MGITITIPKLEIRTDIGSELTACRPGNLNKDTGLQYVSWNFSDLPATYNRTQPIPGDNDNEIRWFRATLPVPSSGLTYGGLVVDIPFYFKKSTGKYSINLRGRTLDPEVDKYRRGILIVSLDGNSPADGKVEFKTYPCGTESLPGTFLSSSEIVNFPPFSDYSEFISRGWSMVPPTGVDLIY